MPHKLSEVIDEKDFQLDRLSKMALKDPSTGGNPKELTEADMKLMYQHFKIVSEPGGAVAAAAAIFSKNKLKEKDIIVVVSGGNVDSEVFSKAISEN